MNAGQNDDDISEVSEREARAELTWVLADPRFHATHRGREVLVYIAERYFEGHTDRVKAYTIALDVLGRSHRFDPNSDPIVRIEVSRLRSALGTYYSTYGAGREISIELPVGRYQTLFKRTRSEPAADNVAVVEEAAEVPNSLPPQPPRNSIPKPMMIISLAVAAVIVGAIAWWSSESLAIITERPRIALDVSAAQAGLQDEADLLHDHLLTALSNFRTVTMAHDDEETAEAIAPRKNEHHRHSYFIELKYYASDADRSVWWQVLDKERATVLASGTARVSQSGRTEVAMQNELVSLLAREFGASRGVISNLETHREPGKRVLGNTCVLRAEFALNDGRRSEVKAAKDCLERTIRSQPANSDAAAVLTGVLVAPEGTAVPAKNLERAKVLAHQAVALDPMSDRAHIALMMVHFHEGNVAAAIAAGNRALALNANSPDVLSKLSYVLFASGYRQSAVSLAEDASLNITAAPNDARLVLALDAYGEGNYSGASLIAEQIASADALVLAVRAAALGATGSPTSRERLEELEELMPNYRTDLKTLMESRRIDPALATSLQRGLHKAKHMNDGARVDLAID